MDVYSVNNTKRVTESMGNNTELLNVKQVIHVIVTELQRVKYLTPQLYVCCLPHSIFLGSVVEY